MISAELFSKHRRKFKWGLIAALCILGLALALWLLGAESWVIAWGGVMFKALSGGVIGWIVSRYVIDLDLSQIPEERRPLAAVSQAILIAAFAIAMAVGI